MERIEWEQLYERLVQALEDLLPELEKDEHHLGRTFKPALRQKLLAAMPGLKERAKTLVELLDSAYYLYAQRPLHLDEKAASLLADGRSRLVGLAEKLEAITDWSAQSVEAVVREHAEAIGAKLGQVAQPRHLGQAFCLLYHFKACMKERLAEVLQQLSVNAQCVALDRNFQAGLLPDSG